MLSVFLHIVLFAVVSILFQYFLIKGAKRWKGRRQALTESFFTRRNLMTTNQVWLSVLFHFLLPFINSLIILFTMFLQANKKESLVIDRCWC
jgi:hypothetical protein